MRRAANWCAYRFAHVLMSHALCVWQNRGIHAATMLFVGIAHIMATAGQKTNKWGRRRCRRSVDGRHKSSAYARKVAGWNDHVRFRTADCRMGLAVMTWFDCWVCMWSVCLQSSTCRDCPKRRLIMCSRIVLYNAHHTAWIVISRA